MLILCVASVLVHAQTVSENDLPEPVQKKFKKMYSKVTDADWSSKDDAYTAEFLVNKAKYSISFNEKGEVVGKKEAVAIATLPQTVGPYMSKNHKGFKMKEAYKITDEKKVVTYEVHSKNKAGDEVTAIFDNKGKFVKGGDE
jgi:hypothetical protein